MISSSQIPLPDNIQHSKHTNIHAPGGIRTHFSAGERPKTYALDRAATGNGGFEPAIPSIEGLQPYALDRAATGMGSNTAVAKCKL